MKRLYEAYFYIPKHGKIRDKVMLTRVVVMATLMIVCLMAMSFTAYAFFTHNISSGANTIQAAVFETTVTILGEDDEQPVKVVASDDKSHLATLTAGVKYKVTVSRTAESTASGFCVVSSEKFPNKYHTQQIGGNSRSSAKDFAFYLTVEETAEVRFFAHWGTSSYYAAGAHNPLYITVENNDITMSKTAIQPSASDKNESASTQTTGKPTSTTPPVQTTVSRTTTTTSAKTTGGNVGSASTTSPTVSVSTGTSTSAALNATDSTVNAATTTLYTYDENQGGDPTHNAKVNGTETVKTGITDQE